LHFMSYKFYYIYIIYIMLQSRYIHIYIYMLLSFPRWVFFLEFATFWT
jgi:hypothetical protein